MMHDQSSGGYDEYFDPPLDTSQECTICLLGLCEPVQTVCGHKFCKACILKALRESPRCPVDNQPLDERQFNADNFTKREILSRGVFCRFKKKHGCPWKGALSNLEDHLRSCDFAETLCPNRCGRSMIRKGLEEHLAKVCPNRMVTCDYCEREMRWNQLEDHHERCQNYPLVCPFCERRNIARIEMDNHLDQECPKKEIKCPFQITGCRFEGQRTTVLAHVNENLASHLIDMINAFASLATFREDVTALNERQIQLERKMQRLTPSSNDEGRICNGTFIWQIPNFRFHRRLAIEGSMTALHSPEIYTSLYGYKLSVRINLNSVDAGLGKHIALFVHMMKGDYDDILKWPFTGKVNLSILDQSSENRKENISQTFEAHSNLASFKKPTGLRSHKGYGYVEFAPLDEIREPKYVRDDKMFVRIQILSLGMEQDIERASLAQE